MVLTRSQEETISVLLGHALLALHDTQLAEALLKLLQNQTLTTQEQQRLKTKVAALRNLFDRMITRAQEHQAVIDDFDRLVQLGGTP